MHVGRIVAIASLVGVASCVSDGPSAAAESFAEKTQQLRCYSEKKIDLLFVVDDSVSMGAFRARWAANLPGFIDVLEQEDVDASYRVAFTTSSVTGPGCANGNDGRLLFESCRAGGSDLVGGPDLEGNAVDLRETCEMSCEAAKLTVMPTEVDGTAKAPRPWLERERALVNVQTDTVDALTCAGQVPVGCPYEQPLEAMKMAIDRMHDVNDPAFGFLRDDAIFLVVFVGDEDDCSIQDADAFFDVAEQWPSSACWRAGAACGPGETGELDCAAARQPDGAPLHDLERYVAVLDHIEKDKQRRNRDQEVLVQVLGGVPQGYGQGMRDLVFEPQEADSPREIGIAPGCEDAFEDSAVRAYPPVRLLAFAERFGAPNPPERNALSVCGEDYTPALKPIADAIRDQIRPGCFESCVADSDPDAPGLQPDCRVVVSGPEGRTDLSPCEGDALPEGESMCFVLKTGGERHQLCVDDGWNLDVELVRDPLHPPADQTCAEVTCSVSTQPDTDCSEPD